MTFALVTLLLLLPVLGGVISGANGLNITTAQGLIDFSNEVNRGTSYYGTTVYLGSDIDFNSSLSEKFEPIGKDSITFFNGTFDGQGHVISNLTLNLNSQYVGLFGYSERAIIKNVVLDESCSITSSYSYALEGSIIGYFYGTIVDFIENIVNMASVTFTGNGTALYLGGIVGKLSTYGTIRNCVNYGSVVQSGTIVKDNVYMGGIVGNCGDTGSKYIQNCANYGTLTHNGTTGGNLRVGGIVGDGYYENVTIENCLSAGEINSAKQSNHTGAIVGYSKARLTNAKHCLWTSNVGYSTLCGAESTINEENSEKITTLNVSTMDELNGHFEKNGTWSNWFMLHLNGGKINNLTQETLIVTQKHFPDPVKEGYTFLFWCKDSGCNEKYDTKTAGITGVTGLYAHYTFYINVTFDFENGTTTTKTVTCGKKYGDLPRPERTGYTFNGWFTEMDDDGKRREITEETTVSITKDHTLYAQWTINNYTITFIFDNGKENEVRSLNFNMVIVYPENPTKEGYIFAGWSPKPERMPAEDITVTAQWAINNYTITFIFDNGKENEVRTLNFNEPIAYPENLTREGFIFNGWSPKPTTMPAEDITVTAQWAINNYTITFIFDNGKENEVRSLNFNMVIVYPENPTKTGYTFNGWSPKPLAMPAEDITVTANWTETPVEPKESSESEVPSFVKIVFEKKDLNEGRIEEIIKEYTKEDFTIERFETDEETGEIRVIIKFNDNKAAESFVEVISISNNRNGIVSADISIPVISFAPAGLHPILLALFPMII